MQTEMTAHQTIQTYFEALTAGDATRLIKLISKADHFVKIGTDKGEIVQGGIHAPAYYRHHVESTEDFRIQTHHLDVHEHDTVAYFLTLQTWSLKWQGKPETLPMRLTGVLEKENNTWKFVQIHASLGTEE